MPIPPFEIFSIIFVVSIVQSLFGVGILLIGTPTLLALGYPYFEALSFLLPTSLAISLIQIVELKGRANPEFVKGILVYTLPFIPVGMVLAGGAGNYLGVIIGILLISLVSQRVSNLLFPPNPVRPRRRFGLGALGFLHGLTNLGGAILPAFNNQRHEPKERKLANIASAYALFVMVQILYIALFVQESFDAKALGVGLCVATGVLGNRLIGKWLYNSINSEKYSNLLKVYVMLIGVLLVARSL